MLVFISPDITRLVLLYVVLPKPAYWVRLRPKFHEKLFKQKFKILSNPACINYIYQNPKYVGNIYHWTKSIFTNKSPRALELFNSFAEREHEMYKIENSRDVKILMAGHPYAYAHTLYEPELMDIIEYRINLLSLNIKCPQLEEYYKKNLSDIELTEIKHIVQNPHMFYLVAHLLPKLLNDESKLDAKINAQLVITSNYGVIFSIFDNVSKNPSREAMGFIEKNINWVFENKKPWVYWIFSNPSAFSIIKFLLESLDRIVDEIDICNIQGELCTNTNPDIINLLRTYPQYIGDRLSANPLDEAIDILLENPKLIDYTFASFNTNPRIVPLLKANIDKLQVVFLASNPLVFHGINFTSKIINKIKYFIDKEAQNRIERIHVERAKYLEQIQVELDIYHNIKEN